MMHKKRNLHTLFPLLHPPSLDHNMQEQPMSMNNPDFDQLTNPNHFKNLDYPPPRAQVSMMTPRGKQQASSSTATTTRPVVTDTPPMMTMMQPTLLRRRLVLLLRRTLVRLGRVQYIRRMPPQLLLLIRILMLLLCGRCNYCCLLGV